MLSDSLQCTGTDRMVALQVHCGDEIVVSCLDVMCVCVCTVALQVHCGDEIVVSCLDVMCVCVYGSVTSALWG